MPLRPFDDNVPFYEFDMDNRANLMLDDHRNMKDQHRHPICTLKTEDADRAYAYVRGQRIPIVLEMQKPIQGLAYFNIEDSEGNVIMICQSDWVNPNPVLPSDPNHPIKNYLSSIVIPVKDLKRSTEWYSKLLGHPIKPERQNGGPIYWFDMSNGTGLLLDDNRNNQDLEGFPTFMLKASHIREAFAWAQDNGIEIVRDVQFDHYFMMKDIEGHIKKMNGKIDVRSDVGKGTEFSLLFPNA
jgi:predicted enzyme related to lactoylglutathione lyase